VIRTAELRPIVKTIPPVARTDKCVVGGIRQGPRAAAHSFRSALTNADDELIALVLWRTAARSDIQPAC